MVDCPFCQMESREILEERGGCVAIYDGFPVTAGHILIVPRRHIRSFRQMTDQEWAGVHALATLLLDRYSKEDASVAGFNLGINDGAVAGQTVEHAHVHWIPRREGDVPVAEGGVRWIFPGKARYRT